jgi:hypothetical protein
MLIWTRKKQKHHVIDGNLSHGVIYIQRQLYVED